MTERTRDALIPPLCKTYQLVLCHEILVFKELAIEHPVWKAGPLPTIASVRAPRSKRRLVRQCKARLSITNERKPTGDESEYLLTTVATYATDSYVTNVMLCSAALPPRVDLSVSFAELGDTNMCLYD
jgi:hypothetical protein